VKYEEEKEKITGLHEMSQYSPEEIRAMNEVGWSKLKEVLLYSDTILKTRGF
jgi:hypothetical protein